MKAYKKSPLLLEQEWGRNLTNHEKALFYIIQQTGPEIKEEHYAKRMEA